MIFMIAVFRVALRNARAQSVIDALSGGSLKAYTDPMPASGASLTTQTLLGTCNFATPAGTVSNGAFTVDQLADGSVVASGAWTWSRCFDSSGNWVADFDVTTDAGTGFLRAASTQLYQGGILRVTGGTISEGQS
jgi:hypothetical protein